MKTKNILLSFFFLLITSSIFSQCWLKMAQGDAFTVAIRTDGTLWVWGNNSGRGVFGNGTATGSSSVPIQIGTNNTWVDVAATFGSVAAIRSNGTLWTWGQNSWGELGNGNNTNNFTPTQVGTATNWTNIHASHGYAYYFSLKSGALWAWGSNVNNGPLGNGTITNINVPTQIGTQTDWRGIYPCDLYTLAIKTNGTLWSWGGNIFSELGYGTVGDIPANRSPHQIGTDTDWKMASGSYGCARAIKNNGTLWAWAGGPYGDGSSTTSSVPIQVGTATDWNTICQGYSCSYAIKTNGTLWSCGVNTNGHLGLGTNTFVNTFTQVGVANDWVYVSTDLNRLNTVALKSDNSLWSAGGNAYGQLGNGTTINSNVFVKVTGCPFAPVANNDFGSTNFGTTAIAIADVRTNDTYNGLAANSSNTILSQVSSTSTGITLNTSTGAITVASTVPVGTYTLVYQLCSTLFSTYCVTATVTICVLPNLVAFNDNYLVDCQGPKNIRKVNLANPTNPDTYNGTPLISQTNITYTQIPGSLSPVPSTGSVIISSTGSFTVSGGVPPGVYSIRYKINYISGSCIISSNEATVTFTVTSPITAAVNDNGTAVSGVASVPVANVLANDIYVGSAIISLVSSSNPGITLNTGTGQVAVNASVPTGNYTLVYRICNDFCTQNCATATVYITVGTPNLVMGERANNAVNLIGLQSTNKIIIGGAFTTYNLISANKIARLNTDLTLDPLFLRTGPVGGNMNDFVILPNDKILVVGNFTSFNGSTSGKGIALLNSDGTPDNTFNTIGIGIGITDVIRSCALQPDGKILIGGSFISTYNGIPVKNMIRLFSDGSIDNSFNLPFINFGNIGANTAAIFEIVVQADNSILVGGNLSPIIGGQKNIFRLLPNGNLDLSFNTGDVGAIPAGSCSSCSCPISEIKIQPDNKIVVVGAFNTYNGNSRKNIVRLEMNGTLDPTFMVVSTSSDKAIKSVEIEPGTNNIYIGGEFTTFNGTSVNRLARLTATGTLDGTFGTGTGVGVFFPLSPAVNVLKRQVIDGKVIVGGLFTTYNSIAAGYITRINPAIAGSQQKRYPNFTTTENTTELKVYPNPSNGIFTIDLTEDTYNKISIINSLGVVVQEYDFNGTSIQVDLSKYPNGQYIARLSSNENTNMIKLMKE